MDLDVVRAVAATIAVAIAACPLNTAIADEPIVGRASVIDGDTIEIRDQRIRLHGIDAPESAQECRRDGRPWRCGQQAALALADRIGTSTVHCVPLGADRYRRVVARCAAGGDDIGGWLVSQGWALDWPRYSKGEYERQQSTARTARRGVWTAEFELPWEWRRR